jgi:hypothetical protein
MNHVFFSYISSKGDAPGFESSHILIKLEV